MAKIPYRSGFEVSETSGQTGRMNVGQIEAIANRDDSTPFVDASFQMLGMATQVIGQRLKENEQKDYAADIAAASIEMKGAEDRLALRLQDIEAYGEEGADFDKKATEAYNQFGTEIDAYNQGHSGGIKNFRSKRASEEAARLREVYKNNARQSIMTAKLQRSLVNTQQKVDRTETSLIANGAENSQGTLAQLGQLYDEQGIMGEEREYRLKIAAQAISETRHTNFSNRVLAGLNDYSQEELNAMVTQETELLRDEKNPAYPELTRGERNAKEMELDALLSVIAAAKGEDAQIKAQSAQAKKLLATDTHIANKERLLSDYLKRIDLGEEFGNEQIASMATFTHPTMNEKVPSYDKDGKMILDDEGNPVMISAPAHIYDPEFAKTLRTAQVAHKDYNAKMAPKLSEREKAEGLVNLLDAALNNELGASMRNLSGEGVGGITENFIYAQENGITTPSQTKVLTVLLNEKQTEATKAEYAKFSATMLQYGKMAYVDEMSMKARNKYRTGEHEMSRDLSNNPNFDNAFLDGISVSKVSPETLLLQFSEAMEGGRLKGLTDKEMYELAVDVMRPVDITIAKMQFAERLPYILDRRDKREQNMQEPEVQNYLKVFDP